METVTKRLYEAMILVDSADAVSDWNGVNEHIKKIFERNGAEIVSMRKWDDRPLAYPILRKNRGTYLLVYFNCPSDKIAPIERDCQLSERILRTLVLRADHITKEDMEKETPAMSADRRVQEQKDSKQAQDTAVAAAAAAEEEEIESEDDLEPPPEAQI